MDFQMEVRTSSILLNFYGITFANLQTYIKNNASNKVQLYSYGTAAKERNFQGLTFENSISGHDQFYW